ncbi:MAG: 1-deoxy-D-xylulose-5-phosphate synthase [Clostridia bacterium]|nr:1-deoxy-D-xylulose-5-phosphate synthase [Clostridia bacterium]
MGQKKSRELSKEEKLLEKINLPEDVKNMDVAQLEQLSGEIRDFLVDKVSKTGGHLASNLGIVEMTIALHKIFDTSSDKVIWDVGHQSYVHKIITGRKDRFDTLRQMDGISGFPKSMESNHDCFNTGHSSTSISAALGMAKARDIKKDDYSVIAVIGDGALTGGMAFEALNDAGRSPNNLIVILNDNEMSISKNVGGMSRYLSRIRTEPFYFKVKEDIDIILNKIPAIGKSAAKALNRAKGTIKYMLMPGIIFEELGFKYLGPIDGHNITELIKVFSRAKMIKGPVFIHICTQKGKGYEFAEKNPHHFHGIAPFEIETGEVLSSGGPGYSDVFGKKLVELAEEDKGIAAITAAMTQGTGLDEFSKKFHNRFFDVGIAEQHAVTFAAGLAISGLKPVVAIYSSFLQRAYDQILHDVALQNLHVVFAIDRAGIVGEDGETHQGLYDLSFLSHIPNMTILAPCDYSEFRLMLEYAVSQHCGPVAIRYPRGKGQETLFNTEPIKAGKGVKIRDGNDITVIGIGNMVETASKVAFMLQKLGISSDVINARFVKPLDSKLIIDSAVKTKRMVIIEDNTVIGGFGSNVLEMLNQRGINIKTKIFGYPDIPIIHGSKSSLLKKFKLDPESLADEIVKLWGSNVNNNC